MNPAVTLVVRVQYMPRFGVDVITDPGGAAVATAVALAMTPMASAPAAAACPALRSNPFIMSPRSFPSWRGPLPRNVILRPCAKPVTEPQTPDLLRDLSGKALAIDGDGVVECTGEQAFNWRAIVKCTWGLTYYGNWQNNYLGGTTRSRADSNCFWSVADITVTGS